MLVLPTLLAVLPSILRSRAAVELENLALAPAPPNRRASEVRCKTPEINLRRPPLVDLSLQSLARLALGAGHSQTRNGPGLASGRLSTVLELEGAAPQTWTTNQLALDFVNTRAVQDGEPIELLPNFIALLRWFNAAGLLNFGQVAALRQEWDGSKRARGIAEAMRVLREKLRKQLLTWERGMSVRQTILDELNSLMAKHPMRTRLKAKGKSCLTELWFEPHEPEDLFAPLAHSAAILLADLDHKRVRKCARCVLHFHDTSKKGTRRWCSMQLCGNRLKVAAYAARRRQRTHE